MITTNVLNRVFQVRYAGGLGTGFTLDVDGRQYFVTAKHVLPDLQADDRIGIRSDGVWRELATTVVGVGKDPVDVAVVALPEVISPQWALPPSAAGITLGHSVFFLGFPFGLGAELGSVNRNYPVPFVKRATLSSFVTEPSGAKIFYLDGNNNPGFSGGPVVFAPTGKTTDFQVASVISGYRIDPQPVFDGDQATQLVARHNTGIIISYEIGHAMSLIESNPVGCPI